MASWFNAVSQSLKDGDYAAALETTKGTLQNAAQKVTTAVDENIKKAAADVDSTSEEIRAKNNIKQKGDTLPWEVSEEKSIVQDDLMEKVLALSLDDESFTTAPMPPTLFDFRVDEHVAVIMKLLQLDPNLAARHARLSPKMNEDDFWKNYFHRCALLRAEMDVGPALPRDTSAAAAEAVAGGAAGRGAAGGGGAGGGGGGGGSSNAEDAAAQSAAALEREVAAAEAEALEAEVTKELEEEDFDMTELGDELDEIDGELDEELEAQIAAELDEGGGGLDEAADLDAEIDGELEGLETEGEGSGSEVLVGGEGSDGDGSGVLINEKDLR